MNTPETMPERASKDDLLQRDLPQLAVEGGRMGQSILMVTPMAGAESSADALARQLGCTVRIAATRKAGLAALRRREYSMVIVDTCVTEADPEGADLLWKYSGLAAPLEVNFAIAGSSRLAREVRAALARRAQEHTLARRAAASTLESELRSTVTGLLLQSQLALAEPALPPRVADKLKIVAELANTLRLRLERSQA